MTQRTCVLHDDGGSDLAVSVHLGLPDEEGWLPCHLGLERGKSAVAASDEQISEVDLKALAVGLRATADSGDRLRWAPTAPSFMVAAERLPNGTVEVVVTVDEGIASGRATTDTGVALVLAVESAALEVFAGCLTS